jgi:hypothetical protein
MGGRQLPARPRAHGARAAWSNTHGSVGWAHRACGRLLAGLIGWLDCSVQVMDP